ncbi:MAG: exosortase [Planctomyces sp.]|nr:exosortase [Planctomyces sp.]
MSDKDDSLRIPPVVHLIFLVSLALLIWGYWPGWMAAFDTWQSDPDYNHGFLVIPIAGWLLWQRRRDLAEIEFRGSWVGLVLIVAAVVFRIAGAEFFFAEFDTWSIPIWIAGVVLLFGGWELLRWSAGAIGFLWFMTPIPGRVTEILSIPLQKVSALLSTWTLLTLGQPAIRQGTTIMLDEHVLEVERACSGLRICYGIAALAVAYILLNRPGWIRSIILLGLTIPIAILANSLRVTGTGLLFLMVSGEAAQKWSHDFAGFAMLPLAIFLLWLFRRLFDRFVDAFQDSPVTGSKMVLKYFSVVAVVGVGLMYWYGIQSEKAIETLVKVADRVEADAITLEAKGQQLDSLKQFNRALLSLDKYLRLRPDNRDVAKRTAVMSEKLALNASGAARTARLYESAWKLLPAENELGVKFAEFSLRGNQYVQAVKAVERLQKELPRDHSDYSKVFGIQLRAAIADASGANPEYNWTHVAGILKSGIENNIDPVQCAFQLGIAYQEKAIEGVDAANREQEAARLFTALLKSRSEDPLAWYAHSVLLKQYPRIGEVQQELETGNPAKVDSDTQLDEAIRLATLSPSKANLPVWLAAGTRAISANELEQAKLHFENAIKADPDHALAYMQLSRIVSGITANTASATVTEQQHLDAVAVLKSGLASKVLQSNVLLRVELLRHQLRLPDSQNQTEAKEQLNSLNVEFQRFSEIDRAPLVLELAFIESQGLADRGNVQDAVLMLEKALQDPLVEKIPKGPGLLSQVWDAMGSWYSRLGQREKAIESFDKAREAEPRSLATLNRSALGAEALNQPDEAAKLYDEMIGLMGDRADLWISKARSELRRQLSRTPQTRDYGEFNTAIQKARELRASPGELAVLQAELLIAQRGDKAGLEFLEEVATSGEISEQIWRALAILRQKAGNAAGSEDALRRVMELNKDVVAISFLKSELMLMAGKPTEARQILADLLATTEDAAVRQRVELRLLELTAVTSVEAAEEMLAQDVAREPESLEKLTRLAEFRWARRNLQAMEESERMIRTVEGDNGTIWKSLRARRLLEQARINKDLAERLKLKTEAEQLLTDLEKNDSGSQGVKVLKARLALLDGRIVEAVNIFQAVWKDGLRSAPMAVELLQALAAVGDMASVRSYLGQMQDLFALSPQLFDIAIAADPATITGDGPRFQLLVDSWAKSLGNSEGALRAARLRRLRISAEPTLAVTLKAEAETEYRKAIELDPSNPQAWGEYLLFVSRDLNQPERMVRELDNVNAETQLSELDRAFITAQLLSDVQLRTLSLHYWRKAINLARGHADTAVEARVLTLAAIAHFDAKPEKAVEYARRIVVIEPENKTHRQFLTMILNEVNVPGVRAEAPRILNEWLPDVQTMSLETLTDEQKRLAAWVLYRSAVSEVGDPLPGAKDAIARADTLLKLIRQQTAEDILLTGQIMIANGDESSGMRILNQRMQLPGTSPQSIRKYIDFCRRRFAGKPVPGDGIERTLSLMERRAGEQVLSLDLRLTQPNLTPEDALKVSKRFVDRIVAARTEAEGQRDLLQGTLSRVLDHGFFEAWMTLVQSDHQLIQEATRIEAATVSLLFMRQDEANEKRFQDYLQLILKKVSGPQLDRVVADYYFSRMLWKESEGFYQKCLKRNPKDTAAMNNLALAVAEARQDFTASHSLLDKAIQIMQTEQPEADRTFLLDSKSLLQLAEGNADASVPVLEIISRRAVSDSSTWLHLAEGYRLQNKLSESRTAFEKAVDIGINLQLMQPIDRRFFEALQAVHAEASPAKDTAQLDNGVREN